MPWYFLSEQDRQVIQHVIDREKAGRENVPSHGLSNMAREDDFATAEVYIAWPPAAGIPACWDDPGTAPALPGEATCDIYRIKIVSGEAELTAVAGLSHKVYNLSNAKVDQDWVVVARDTFGKWLVIGGAVGLPPGTTDNDILRWDHTGTGSGGEGEWVIHSAPASSGTFALTVVDGTMTWTEFTEFECPGTGS
jgi:hypothetical protein